jgi:hypothetical protein
MIIYPKCKYRDDQVPILRVDGYVGPCCHFGGEQPWYDLKQLLGEKIEQLHITKGTMDEINRSEASYMIEQSFTEAPMDTCKQMCDKPFLETSKKSGFSTANNKVMIKNLNKSRLDD